MTLQTSGAISLSQVQSEYGGSNPISMSEYYRDGANVPSTINSGAGAWSSYQYSRTGSNDYYWSHNIFAALQWNGGVPSAYLGASTTSYSYGGYTYERGNYVTQITTGSGKSATTTSYYYIRRRQNASTINVNGNVPTSGTISMDDFYGGRKT